MNFTQTVVLLGWASAWTSLASGCARPAKEHPAGSAPSGVQAPSSDSPSPSATAVPAPAAPATPSPSSSASSSLEPPGPGNAPPTGSSAYVGCGAPIPLEQLWDETSEGQVLDGISAAKACAAEHGRRLLLEFVAPWCADCREMAKLDESPVVASTLKERFERVRVNVGKWDHHEALRTSFDVHALATYIVIDPKTGKQLAKTTLEPITKKGQKLSAQQWASWLSAY